MLLFRFVSKYGPIKESVLIKMFISVNMNLYKRYPGCMVFMFCQYNPFYSENNCLRHIQRNIQNVKRMLNAGTYID